MNSFKNALKFDLPSVPNIRGKKILELVPILPCIGTEHNIPILLLHHLCHFPPPYITILVRVSSTLVLQRLENFLMESKASPNSDLEDQTKTRDVDYSKRSQWLRAAVLGANDGLVSTASLMVGVGAVKQDCKAMILTGFAGLIAGACSMAIGEFVSVYSQLDIELAQMRREKQKWEDREEKADEEEDEDREKESLPNPLQAAGASAFAFSVGAFVPLMAASFISEHRVRLGAVAGAVTVALIVFGWVGAVLGKSSPVKSACRVLIGGWIAMAVTFWVVKWVSSTGHNF